jgi:hypothetical protein
MAKTGELCLVYTIFPAITLPIIAIQHEQPTTNNQNHLRQCLHSISPSEISPGPGNKSSIPKQRKKVTEVDKKGTGKKTQVDKKYLLPRFTCNKSITQKVTGFYTDKRNGMSASSVPARDMKYKIHNQRR